MTFSTEEKLKCAQRELALRVSAYPGFIRRGKLKEATAKRELAIMQEIVEDYTAKLASEGP